MEDFPTINFLAAIGIGLVIGLIGAFVLRSRQPNAMWLAPVLGLAGALVASLLALAFGDTADYGWKEPILQVVLAVGGVGVAAFLGPKKPESGPDAAAGKQSNEAVSAE